MEKMKTHKIKRNFALAMGALFVALSLGCSKNKFSASSSNRCNPDQPEKTCQLSCDADGQNCKQDYDYQTEVETSIADILFVVDNSGSMSPEQKLMGAKFPSFLQSISNLDYRVGVTTTDISSSSNPASPINLNGQLQDGRLIEFESGRPYLDGSLSSSLEQTLFERTVSRKETEDCEANGYALAFCPSGYERGILAAYMTVFENYNNFLRSDGHLAVVVLSDEDEWSEGNTPQTPFVHVEHPQNFVDTVKTLYPNKTLEVHSIVIQPGDTVCESEQRIPGTPRGFFGDTYSELTRITGGINGSICDNNYSSLLQDIGDQVAIPREALPCRPQGDQLNVSFVPEPPYQVDVQTDFDRLEVNFSRALPKGTKIRFQFSCSIN